MTRPRLAELLDGLRFVWGHGLILSMVLVVTVANLLDAPKWGVIMPVYAREIFGSAVSLGVMLGGFVAGALSGTLIFAAIGHRLPRRLTFVVCFVAVPTISYTTLILAPPLPIIVGALVFAGLIAGPLNPIISTVVQEQTPVAMRGRVFGVLDALALGGVPIGMAVVGFVIEGIGLVPTLAGMGVCYLLVTLSMFFNPALRDMDRTPGGDC